MEESSTTIIPYEATMGNNGQSNLDKCVDMSPSLSPSMYFFTLTFRYLLFAFEDK